MQLQPGEKSILAYFITDSNARQAAADLQSRGFNHISISRLSSSSKRSRNHTSNLSSLTVGDYYGYNPLLAADPDASGLSSGESPHQGYSHLVTVVTTAENINTVKATLIANGALI